MRYFARPEQALDERVVAGLPAFEVARETVRDLHAEACGHRGSADGAEGALPRDAPGEAHPPFAPRRPELEPHLLPGVERREGAHVETAGADVVREAHFVFVAARRAEGDRGAVEEARGRALVDAARREELVDHEERVLGRREAVDDRRLDRRRSPPRAAPPCASAARRGPTRDPASGRARASSAAEPAVRRQVVGRDDDADAVARCNRRRGLRRSRRSARRSRRCRGRGP